MIKFKEFSKKQVFAEIIEDLDEERLGLYPAHEIIARERELLVLTDGIDNEAEGNEDICFAPGDYEGKPCNCRRCWTGPLYQPKQVDSFEPPF